MTFLYGLTDQIMYYLLQINARLSNYLKLNVVVKALQNYKASERMKIRKHELCF